jgi:hypothetical protein
MSDAMGPYAAAAIVLALLGSGCATLSGAPAAPAVGAAVDTVAVLPLARDENRAQASDRPELLPPDAERVVTAQIYGVLVERARWHVVPDLTVDEALRRMARDQSLESRARELGRAVGADAVLCGSVSRFVEREGSELGSRRPASVSFELKLVLADSGAVVWRGAFDQTQQPLSSNLLNWWMFWRAGPRWFAAHELARLGVERLIADLERHL